MVGVVFLGLRILMAIVLYSFLFWALWILWNDLRQRGKSDQILQIPKLSLEIESELERKWQYDQAEIIIGRDPACECRIEDATISARHARLSYNLGQWWIEDLHSKNGTLLNGQPFSEQVVLASNDLLQCGKVIFRIKLEETDNFQHETVKSKGEIS